MWFILYIIIKWEKKWKLGWSGRLHEEEEIWLVRKHREGGSNPSQLVLFTHTLKWLHAHQCNWVNNFQQTPQNKHTSFARPVRHGGNFAEEPAQEESSSSSSSELSDRYFLQKKLSLASVKTTSRVQPESCTDWVYFWLLHMHTRLCFPPSSSSPRTYHTISIRTCS